MKRCFSFSPLSLKKTNEKLSRSKQLLQQKWPAECINISTNWIRETCYMGIPPIGVVREAQNTMKLCKLFKNLYKNVMGTTRTRDYTQSNIATINTINNHGLQYEMLMIYILSSAVWTNLLKELISTIKVIPTALLLLEHRTTAIEKFLRHLEAQDNELETDVQQCLTD